MTLSVFNSVRIGDSDLFMKIIIKMYLSIPIIDMMKLKAHYEEKISVLNSEAEKLPQPNKEVINKIQALKSSLVGGECANNTQLKEKRRRKKIAAEHRMMEISNAINSVEHTQSRDILQGHYTDIQQELKLKTDALKSMSRKVLLSFIQKKK